MNKGKNLIKNTLVLLIGKISVQFISFLMLPLYTGVLSTNDYGIIDIVLTYVALFSPVVTLQLEMAVFRFLVDKCLSYIMLMTSNYYFNLCYRNENY